jgi:hypothetical protein
MYRLGIVFMTFLAFALVGCELPPNYRYTDVECNPEVTSEDIVIAYYPTFERNETGMTDDEAVEHCIAVRGAIGTKLRRD